MIHNTNKDLSDWLFLFGSILTTGDLTACRSAINPTLAKIGDDFLNAYHVLNELEGKDTLKPLSTLMQIADEKIVAENNTDQKLSDLLSSMLDMSDELATKYVYNRCFVYYGTQELAIQKENKSKEDFILNNPTGTPYAVNHYLQAMVNYPSISATNNPIPILQDSTFKCANVTIGVEICVDHCCARLSNYVFQKKIEPVDIQIVISSGMQLMVGSVATKVDGVLLNCDGEYQIIGDADNGVQCHTQLKTYTSVAGAAPGLSYSHSCCSDYNASSG
ncbi:MAG: hypothetical protein H7259_04685 [Cytophagales bacterium]|nr:hypothetical protein [Cytophaga sp.]